MAQEPAGTGSAAEIMGAMALGHSHARDSQNTGVGGNGLLDTIVTASLLGGGGLLGGRAGVAPCGTPLPFDQSVLLAAIADASGKELAQLHNAAVAEAKDAADIREAVAASGRTTDNQFCALDKSVHETSTHVSELMFNNATANGVQFANINSRIADGFCSVEKRGLQDKFELSNAITAVALQGERNTNALNNKIESKADEIIRTLADKERRDLQRELDALLADNRRRDTEHNITQTVVVNQQQQQQQQQQLQLQDLNRTIATLAADIQHIRSTQSTVNFGTMTGTSQAASNSNNSVR